VVGCTDGCDNGSLDGSAEGWKVAQNWAISRIAWTEPRLTATSDQMLRSEELNERKEIRFEMKETSFIPVQCIVNQILVQQQFVRSKEKPVN
jgi:hypothetical protein